MSMYTKEDFNALDISMLEAEVDYLKAERDAAITRAEEAKQAHTEEVEYVNRLRAENEKLRKDQETRESQLKRRQDDAEKYAERNDLLRRENEKLRGSLAAEQDCAKDLLETCGDLGREKDLLRNELRTIAEKTAREQREACALAFKHPPYPNDFQERWAREIVRAAPLVTDAPSKAGRKTVSALGPFGPLGMVIGDPDAIAREIAAWPEEASVTTDGHCKCGLHAIRAGITGIVWYWSRHTREECLLQLPNERCWCGRLRSEHQDEHGHASSPPAEPAAEAIDEWTDAKLIDWLDGDCTPLVRKLLEAIRTRNKLLTRQTERAEGFDQHRHEAWKCNAELNRMLTEKDARIEQQKAEIAELKEYARVLKVDLGELQKDIADNLRLRAKCSRQRKELRRLNQKQRNMLADVADLAREAIDRDARIVLLKSELEQARKPVERRADVDVTGRVIHVGDWVTSISEPAVHGWPQKVTATAKTHINTEVSSWSNRTNDDDVHLRIVDPPKRGSDD